MNNEPGDIICSCGHFVHKHTYSDEYTGCDVDDCRCRKLIPDIVFEYFQPINDWKYAVEDACIVSWVPITTPKETVAKLIEWNVKMALDPAISKDANDLIERGRNEK